MKSFFTNQGAFSVVYLVLGILLLIHPVAFSRAVCYVLGICAFVYGAWKIWGYWKDRKLGGVFQLELIVGVISWSSAWWLSLNPRFCFPFCR